MKIKFIDLNKSLVTKIKKAVKYFPVDIEVKQGDIFAEDGVIVSASNPQFSMGGGLDAAIKKHYPEECSKVKKQGQIGNVMFTITVGDDLKATRELVDSALAFALDEKNHIAPDQTMLISGLGTGIGGLDEDDFVWLFLKNISIVYGYGWGIKFTQKNGTDYRTGKVLYKPGKVLEEPEAKKSDESCSVGLHIGRDFIGAGNYHLPGKIFFCIYDKNDLCHQETDKVRLSKLTVVAELPLWLGYGENGKKFNPKKYNPYQATKLPSIDAIKKTGVRNQVWNQVLDQVRNQVRNQVLDQVRNQVRNQVLDQVWNQVLDQVLDQVRNQVRNQVGNQVGNQVLDQVLDQVWNQVLDQVWNQVRNQVGNQVWNQVWNQLGNQVGATSYWSVNAHFELGLSHWFYDFLKLGIVIVFVGGKIKVFGKKGKYLGEYDEKELLS